MMNASVIKALSAVAILAAPARFAAVCEGFRENQQRCYMVEPVIWDLALHGLSLQ